MLLRALNIAAIFTLAGCAALDTATQSGGNNRLDALTAEVEALQTEVREARQHLRAIDMTERTARADLASRVDAVGRDVRGLPDRIAAQCEPQTTIAAECDNAPQQVEMRGDKAVLGELEEVWLAPPGARMVARMDTGATSSSLHASKLVRFERDGDDWVRFNLEGTDGEIEFEAAVLRTVRVLQQADPKGSRRPVVAIRVRLGDIDQTVEFTLADRAHLENSLILGRNFLKDLAVVDVARQFVQPRIEP